MSKAQLAAIVLTIHDGTTPLVPSPTPAPIYIAQSTDGEIPYSAVGDDAAPFVLTGWTIQMVVRGEPYEPDPPPISHQQVPATMTTGIFPIGASDTTPMDLRTNGYRISFEATDPNGARWQVRGPTQFFVTEAESRPDTEVTVPTGYPPLGQGPQGVPQAPRVLIYSGAIAAGTFVKTSSTPGEVSQLLTTGADNPLYRTGIALVAGADAATGSVVQVAGQQVTMALDDAADAVCGQFAYYSQLVDGAVSALPNGLGPASIFQTNGAAGTTADILS